MRSPTLILVCALALPLLLPFGSLGLVGGASMDHFAPEPLSLIQHPLFTRPEVVEQNKTFNVQLKLNEGEVVQNISLVGQAQVVELSFTIINGGGEECLAHVPENTTEGLFSLQVVTNSRSVSTWHSVKVLAIQPDHLKVVHITDTHIGMRGIDTLGYLREMTTAINRLQPDLVIHTGDVVDGGDLKGGEPEAVSRYEQSLTALSNLSAPLLVINGNHDVYWGLDYWKQYMGSNMTYGLSYGKVHFSLMNLEVVGGFPPSIMNWAEADLASHPHHTKVLVYHTDYVNQLINGFGADIHLLGHEHRSIITEHDSFLEIITSKTYALNKNEPGVYRTLEFQDGVLINNTLTIMPLLESTTTSSEASITESISVDTNQTAGTSLPEVGFILISSLTATHIIGRKKRR